MFHHDELRRRAEDEADELWLLHRAFGIENPFEDDFESGPTVQMDSASAIAPEPIEWLWAGRIPLGMLALFSGDPKLGKSLAALAVVAAVTRGGPLPGGDAAGPATAPRGSAILLSGEDDPARTIVPRLIAAGADLDRVKIIRSMLEPGARGDDGLTAPVPARERMPTLAAGDLAAIEAKAAELGDCRLIVFDPITAYVDGRHGDVRRALGPLKDMARRLGAAVLLINHHSKQGAAGTNGKYRVLGQIAYVAVCRANFMFLADPDDPSGRRRLMLDNGTNQAARLPALPYVVREEGGAPVAEWLAETIDLDADAALARAVKGGKSGGSGPFARPRAVEEWLRGYLADGPKSAKECEQAALAAGFNRGHLVRARQSLAIRCGRMGFGKGACYHLWLPEADGEPPAHLDPVAGAHAAQFSVSDSRVQHVQHVQHGGPNGQPPPADWTPGNGAAPVGDEAA